MTKLHRTRPAEVGAVGAGGITALAAALGASQPEVAVLAFMTGAVPAAISYLVDRGGLRGIWRSLVNGKP